MPRITCAMSPMKLSVEKARTYLASRYFVQAIIVVPRMKTPTTKLKSLCVSSMINFVSLRAGSTAPLHNGQESPHPRPELLVVTYPPNSIRIYVERTDPYAKICNHL